MDEYIVVKSPLLETLLMQEDFHKHAQQIDTINLIIRYGNKSFLVEKEWISKVGGNS
jgi:hypothetical protein